MSELKADKTFVFGEECEAYKKSEADKVIADLEESHKMEVEQLLMEIVELKADYKEACDRLQTANLIKDEQLAATRHNKYKRCLNKAEWCEERCARYDLLQEHYGLDWSREIGFYFKWQQRWLELAEKFNEGFVIGVDKATGTDKTVVINYKEAK